MQVTDALARITIDRDTPVAPYFQLYSELKRLINEGCLKAGERLPSISELSARYSLSRTTVARALSELSREGLIVSRWGAGSFVARRNQPTTEVLIHGNQPRPGSRVSIFYEHLLKGLREGFADADRSFSLSYLDGRTPDAREMLAVAEARRADTLVVYRPQTDLALTLQKVSERIPTVTLLGCVPEARADAVIADLSPVIRQIVQSRLRQGCRAFALVAGREFLEEPDDSPYVQMYRAYLETMQACGLVPSIVSVSLRDPLPVREAAACAHLADLPDGAVVFMHSLHSLELPSKYVERIGYTESPETLEQHRGKATVMYLGLARVAATAARLALERRQSGNSLQSRLVRLAPELIGGTPKPI